MSREEAAGYYLDGLLGFRGDFGKFSEAASLLSDQDLELLHNAASFRPVLPTGEGKSLFVGQTDNDYQFP